MAETQQLLFPPPQPLVDRFGREFFHALPETPGVYFMCGDDAGVLYVGKAKNLRKRLSSYRSANPERLARRIFRLLFRVTRIYWDECASEAAALERERQLLLVLQPRFNAAGRYPPPMQVLVPERPPEKCGTASPSSFVLVPRPRVSPVFQALGFVPRPHQGR